MVSTEPSGWTLDELAARAALALSDAPGQPSGRVREVPDLRSIRYYTTLGLLDRPLSFRGRTAIYGTRHLAQLVAIKRLQGQGQSLSQVQRTLSNLDEHALLRLAALPHEAEAEHHHPHAKASAAPAPARGEFWKHAPAEIPAPAPALKEGPQLRSVSLDATSMLVIESARELDAADLEALRVAAAPLLKLLQKRGLSKPPNPEEV